MMAWVPLAVLLLALMAWWFFARQGRVERNDEPPPRPLPDPALQPYTPVRASVAAESADQRERRLLAAASEHGPALVCLLCVARADGRLSDGEEHEMLAFLESVGQLDLQTSIVARVKMRFKGTWADFEAGVAQIQDDRAYREKALRAMERIVRRGKLAHPDELAIMRAQPWAGVLTA